MMPPFFNGKERVIVLKDFDKITFANYCEIGLLGRLDKPKTLENLDFQVEMPL